MAYFMAPIAAIIGGLAAKGQADYRAKVAKNNAIQAERNANLAAEQAQKDALRSDREYADVIGTQLAVQSASGLDVLGKSQLRTRELTGRTQKVAAQDIYGEGATKTANFFIDASNFHGEAGAQKAAGTAALVGSIFEAGASLAGNSSFNSLIGGAKKKSTFATRGN